MCKAKYLVMDVDGTLTDGKLYIGENGEVVKVFSAKDGAGINIICKTCGIEPIVMTARRSAIVINRARELGIEKVFQGVENKKEELRKIFKDVSTVAYIGDDLADVDAMSFIHSNGGVVGCPADAVNEVIEIADFVSNRNGGDGAVREFIEWLVQDDSFSYV